MTTPQDPWSAERLEAAFQARARQHEAPAGLTPAVVEAVRHAGAPPAQGRPWASLVPLAAALSLLAVVLGGPLLAGRSPVSTDPPSSVAPSASDVDERVFGLPVIDVRAAAAIRDAGVDDRALAVRGWLAFDGIECPAVGPGPVSPLQLGCDGERRALLASPDVGLVGYGADPDPSVLLQALLDWAPDVPPSQLAELVVVGHFDDRRATLCPPDELQACRDRFVVDRLVAVDGREVADRPVDQDIGAHRSLEEVESAVTAVAPTSTILSATPYRGDGLYRVEPGLDRPMLGGADDGAMTFLPVWRVQALDDGRVSTFLVTDRWLDVSRVGADNRAELLASGPRPSGDAWVWPRLDAHSTIRLTNDLLALDVAVVDRSGRLVEVRPAIPSDVPEDHIWVRTASHLPGGVMVGWTASPCDHQAVLTIASADSMLLDEPPRPGCDAMAVAYAVILVFDGPIDIDAIDITRMPTEIHRDDETSSPDATTPAPSDAEPWPPAGTDRLVRVDGDFPIDVAVIDPTDRLVATEAAALDDRAVAPSDQPVLIEPVPNDRRSLLVTWSQNACYPRAIVLVTGSSIELEHVPALESGSSCDGLAGRFRLRLTFSEDVNARSLDGIVRPHGTTSGRIPRIVEVESSAGHLPAAEIEVVDPSGHLVAIRPVASDEPGWAVPDGGLSAVHTRHPRTMLVAWSTCTVHTLVVHAPGRAELIRTPFGFCRAIQQTWRLELTFRVDLQARELSASMTDGLVWRSHDGAYRTLVVLAPGANPSLRHMRFPTDADPDVPPPGETGYPSVVPEPDDPNSVRVRWDGSLCDDRAIISVPDVNRISVRTERAEGACRLALVQRSLILTFDEPVDLARDGG
jgi:hypothetical protein